MENIIVEEGGSVERLLSSEVFMARVIFIKLYFGNKMKTWVGCSRLVSGVNIGVIMKTKLDWINYYNNGNQLN